ncbi:MAG TPA: hypothetical protein VGF77_03190 [Allosphingosinicella sp.]|jgi:hypothetical protein
MKPVRSFLLAAAPMAMALALAGCGRNQAQTQQNANPAASLPPLPASLPLSAVPPAGPIAHAPRVNALPRARPLDYGYVPPDQDYAWIDRADTLFDTIGDAPPDYGFDYDGVEPWGWETADGYEVVAEPIDDGYRYYYYDPGDDTPFFVRDPYYGYGYGDGRLVAVYSGGRLLGRAEAARQSEAAARYWARAQALRRADQAVGRRPVSAPLWARQQPYVVQAHRQWAQARAQDPAWRQWRARQPNGPAMARLQAERQLRAGAAQRFATWQRRGLSGPAPRLYPAASVRRPSEPIMRPGAPTLFGPGAQRRTVTAAAPLPRVQASPVLARQAALAQAQQARARQAQAAQAQAAQTARVAAVRTAQTRQVQLRAQDQAQRAALAQRSAQAARTAAIRQQGQARVAQARVRQQAAVQVRARQQAVAAQAHVRQQAAVQARTRQQAAVQVRVRQQAVAAQARVRRQDMVQARVRQQAVASQARARQQAAVQVRARQQAVATQVRARQAAVQVRAVQVRAQAQARVAAVRARPAPAARAPAPRAPAPHAAPHAAQRREHGG